ncbi:MAG: PDZ domain-containing protein [Haliscomenobacteraceae bacterium CHB4]|nr:PDZ domain-containing protein [Haliscomenobacteraceae bacterium CHB4]
MYTKVMKTVAHLLAAAFILMPWCAAPLFSQQNAADEKIITITKHTIEADGSQTSETIIKKGNAAENFDVDKYIRENKADNVQLEVRVESGSADEKSLIVKRSPGINKSNSSHYGNYRNDSNDDNDRAFLGVEEDSDEDADEPGLVVEVVRGSAADKAGLRDNDVILQLNDTKTDRWSDLSKFVKNAKPGDKVKISYRRNGKEATTEAVLITRDQLEKNDKKEPRGFLGVSPDDDDDEDKPGVVVNITRNSGAEKAGLQNGDVLFQLDDAPITDFEDVSDFMEYTKPGDKVRVTYERKGQRNTVEATLGEQKAWDWDNWNMGNLNLDDLNIDIREKDACLGVYTGAATINDQRGAKISGFTSESAARDAQMQTGDLITTINGQRIQGHDDLWNEIAKFKVGDKVKVEYLRDNQPLQVEATLKACRDQSRVDIWDTDEKGNNQSRRFFTWNWDKDDQQRLRENRVITIRKATEGDAQNANSTPDNQPVVQDRNLDLESFRVYPNPTQGPVTIEFRAEPVATLVTLYDMSGRQLFREELNAFSGEYNQQFDLSEYAKGNIIVHVQQSEKVFTEQIVVN